MKPNARSVITALRRVENLPYSIVANGHGPLLRYNLQELVGKCVPPPFFPLFPFVTLRTCP
jgi:flavorubredoxin